MKLEITWERIANTLEELVGMGDLAQEIRKKFINFAQPGLSVVKGMCYYNVNYFQQFLMQMNLLKL